MLNARCWSGIPGRHAQLTRHRRKRRTAAQYFVSIAHEHPMVCTVDLEDGAVFDLSAKLLARVAVDAVESANHVLPRRRVLAVGALPRLELSD